MLENKVKINFSKIKDQDFADFNAQIPESLDSLNALLLLAFDHHRASGDGIVISPLIGVVTAAVNDFKAQAYQIQTRIGFYPNEPIPIPINIIANSFDGVRHGNSAEQYLIPIQGYKTPLRLGVSGKQNEQRYSIFLETELEKDSLRDFNNFMKVYFGVLQELINHIYRAYNIDRPKLRLDTALDLNRVKTADDLQALFDRHIGMEPPEVQGMGGKYRPPKADQLKEITERKTFDDIGGQPAAVEELREIADSIKDPGPVIKWGGELPKGILLYGPPGCGKTTLAKAVAQEADVEFYNLQFQDITSKWRGQEQRALRDFIRNAAEIVAKTKKKAIIFMDEIDGIGGARDSLDEYSAKTVTTLCSEMDGYKPNQGLIFIAATNRHFPEKGESEVDPALLRPGRLDKWVYVGLPDREGRKTIFGIYLRKAVARTTHPIFGDRGIQVINLDELAEATDLYSGADIEEVMKRVVRAKIREERRGIAAGPVVTEDILAITRVYERGEYMRHSQHKPIGFLHASN